jgi:predicted N-acyltransferase
VTPVSRIHCDQTEIFVVLNIRVHSRIEEIPLSEWNALLQDNNPFLRHEFLHALEEQGCVGEEFGWLPCHIAVYEGGQLTGAMPLYEKTNSYGEFVFDNAWAAAYERAGLSYFPKLVSAVPYTPAAGQRLLCQPGRSDTVYPVLLRAVNELMQKRGASGYHCLFPNDANQQYLDQQSLMVRHDYQFHWHNPGYSRFDDFLSRLASRKSKKIRQERRKVGEAGVTLRRLDGYLATEQDWRDFSRFYRQTFEEKWGVATLNESFFRQVAEQLPDQVLLVLADLQGECIAGSLMYLSDTRLYGRYWGSVRQVNSLHFEACYYQGIEHCIEHNLQIFEPGAQGEHKISRGFLPRLTRSYHWLAENPFQRSIEDFVGHERLAVAGYMKQLNALSPYRQELE